MIADLDEAKFRIQALTQAKPCLCVGEARSYLHTQQYRYRLLDLYQWTLPESFRQHPHRDRYRPYVEGKPLNQSHSLLEVGFLEKLGDLLPEVPWHDDWYTEGVVGDIAEEGLPLMDLGLNIYAEDILEQLEPAFLVLVALSEHGQFVLSQCQDDLEDLLKDGHLWPVMQRALASPTATSPAQRHAVRRRFNRPLAH